MSRGDGSNQTVSRQIDDLSDAYVEAYARLHPVAATFDGIAGHDHELTDYSPDAAAERADHDRATLRRLDTVPLEDDADSVAAGVIRERLEVAVELHDRGEHLRSIAVLGSAVQEVREAFDMLATDTEQDWETVAARMARVPECVASLEAAFTEGRHRGLVASTRQVTGAIAQVEVWAGLDADGTPPYFHELADRLGSSGVGPSSLHATVTKEADRATAALASLARYLTLEYAVDADPRDAVGEERYAIGARVFNGTVLDLHETYAWGWEELRRIEHAVGQVAARILPNASVGEVVELLETDPARAIEGEDNLAAWLQDLMDRTIAEMNGVHFDIPEPVKTVEAMIAPPGGASAMYYTGPSEDFSRPGRTWYPTMGNTRFPLWGEVSICYHEGVPGHHLQVAQVRYLADTLTRFQRTLAWSSGHGEGWALYAERLMGELGYLENPDYELGMLRAQAMRAVRVIVDIGMHLELPIPADESYHPGERWTPELALPFVIQRAMFAEQFMRSEVDRYLGIPGQAISYKVGERVWLESRADAQARHGADFDLKAWHSHALNLGSMGLDQFRAEMARY
ncbi:MAG: DUF885 domain-containing protein [Acidimicrobiia bacterium]